MLSLSRSAPAAKPGSTQNPALRPSVPTVSPSSESCSYRLCRRVFAPHEPRLQPSVQRMLLHKVASLVGALVTLDSFACHQSRVCQRYALRLSEPAALASDGLALDWWQEVVWLNPPWALLPDIIGKLAAERPAGVLIVPCWTTQVWWPSLLALGGCALDLPPPLFSVDPLHPRPVEPFLHPGLRLRAVVFQRGTQP